MDDRIRAEFPLGDKGRTVIVSEPTEGQVLVLAMASRPGGSEMQMISRVVRVLETLTGAEQWEIVEDSMISGEVSAREFLELVSSVLTFDWPSHTTPAPAEKPSASPAPRIVPNG
jgi:hypothetical protein